MQSSEGAIVNVEVSGRIFVATLLRIVPIKAPRRLTGRLTGRRLTGPALKLELSDCRAGMIELQFSSG